MSRIDIIDEIDQLQAKLNVQPYGGSAVMDSKEFDLIGFFKRNFALAQQSSNDGDIELDMDKMLSAMTDIHELQRETCEQIAISVDLNLDNYVEISTKFEGLKDYFSKTDGLYTQIESEMQISKRACSEQIDNVNEALENYQLICYLESDLEVLQKVVSTLKKVDLDLILIRKGPFQGFKILQACSALRLCKTLFKERVETALQTRELASKYKLVQSINECFAALTSELDRQFRTLLSQFQQNPSLSSQDINIRRKLVVLLRAFASLGSVQTVHKAVGDVIIRPYFESVFRRMQECKKSMMFVATKQEFEEKHNNLRILPLQILQNSLTPFIGETYQPFMSVLNKDTQDQREDIQMEYNCHGYDFVQVLLDCICEFFKGEDMAFVFSFSSSDLFFGNYLLFQSLLNQIKSLQSVPSDNISDVEGLIQSKWNVKTYFYMRQAEIVKDFEGKLSQVLSPALENDALYTVLVDAVSKCFDADTVFLQKACVMFLKLSLQLISRFSIKVQAFNSQGENSKKYEGEMVNSLCRLESHLPDFFKTKVQSKFQQDSERDLINQVILEVKKMLRLSASAFINSKLYQSKTKALNNN